MPTYDLTRPIVNLEDWTVVHLAGDYRYTAPEDIPFCLMGKCTGHPFHKDGTVVRTGVVQSYDFEAGFAVTENTFYLLGEPLKVPDNP